MESERAGWRRDVVVDLGEERKRRRRRARLASGVATLPRVAVDLVCVAGATFVAGGLRAEARVLHALGAGSLALAACCVAGSAAIHLWLEWPRAPAAAERRRAEAERTRPHARRTAARA